MNTIATQKSEKILCFMVLCNEGLLSVDSDYLAVGIVFQFADF